MNIIVNGIVFRMDKGKDCIKYETLADIAGHDFRHKPTIIYRSDHRSGELMGGEVLLVAEGMNVTCVDTCDA